MVILLYSLECKNKNLIGNLYFVICFSNQFCDVIAINDTYILMKKRNGTEAKSP